MNRIKKGRCYHRIFFIESRLMFMGVATHQPRNQSGCQPSDPLSLNPWIGQCMHDFLLLIAPISPPASISLRGSNATTRLLLLSSIPAVPVVKHHGCRWQSAPSEHQEADGEIGNEAPEPRSSDPLQHHVLHHNSERGRRVLHCSMLCCITTLIDASECCIAATELPASAS